MRQSQSSVLPETPGEGEHQRQRSPRPPGTPLTERVAGWSARHRKTAVFGWLLLIVALFAAGQMAGQRSLTPYDPGQSGQAERTLHQVEPGALQDYPEAVLIQSRTAGVHAAAGEMRQAAAQVTAALKALPKTASGIQAPVTSADGRSLLVSFAVPGNVASADQAALADQHAVAGVQARHPSLRIAESGDASLDQAVSSSLNFGKAEATSVPIALVLLLFVFGGLVAAGIPVLLAFTALTAGLGVLTALSHWLPVISSSYEVVVIIGMAVGVDYSLFYLRREREERARGATPAEALRIASRTSGRAIAISGVTVMIAVSGLLLTGLSAFTGMAIGTIAVVGIAVVGSLTVLPALLSWLGPRAEAGRIPFWGRRRAAARPSRAWAALARRVVARPVAWGGVALIALLALAAPALGMRIGSPAIDAPHGAPATVTMTAIQRAFPQAPAPAQVVVTGQDPTGPAVLKAVNALKSIAASSSGVIHEPVTASAAGGGRALILGVPLAGTGSDSASSHALVTLRDHILPETLGKVPGVHYAVAGDTASLYDVIQQLHHAAPLVVIAIAALAFMLLLLAFRSVAVSLASIAANLLSVGAAYGLITLIFQDGRLQGLLGYTSFGGIISWEPLFMFVFLFGISMDYHVFILSRIRELRQQGMPARDAVTGGIASSAGVVTSAALIMVAVFSIFTTMSLIDLKILGIGTAAAIAIDATVIRGILVPAALSLLGNRLWRPAPGR